MKRKMFNAGIILLLLFAASFHSHSQSLKKVQSEIEEMNSKMMDAMMKGDYNATLGMYTEDAYSLPSYEPMMKGIQAIEEAGKEMANSPMKIKSFDIRIKEIIEGGDLYIEIGEYEMSMGMEGMPEPFKDHGKYVTIWERQKDGSLKIKLETWNSDMNPWNEGEY